MNQTERTPLPDFDAEWNFNQPAATGARFAAIHRQTQRNAPPHYTAELLTQIARTHSLQREFEQAHQVLARVEPLLRRPGMQTARIRYLLEKGRTHNTAGQKQTARRYFTEAWQLAQARKLDVYAVDAAHMLAIAEPPRALHWNETALALANASPSDRARKWRGSLNNNLGWTHFAAQRYPQALKYFEASLACRQEAGEAGEIQIAQWSIAKTYRHLDRVDEALAILRALEADPREDAEPGYTFEELAECLLVKGESVEAAVYFEKTLARLGGDTWLQEHEPERITRWRTHSASSSGEAPSSAD